MDTIIAIELVILIILGFMAYSRISDLITAAESVTPQIKRLEGKLDGLELAITSLRPRRDTNPHPFP